MSARRETLSSSVDATPRHASPPTHARRRYRGQAWGRPGGLCGSWQLAAASDVADGAMVWPSSTMRARAAARETMAAVEN